MNVSLVVFCAVLASFLWRAAGALAAGRVRAHSPVFSAAACVSYAMVGALVVKLIVFPQGAAADPDLWRRLLAIAGALAVFYLWRNIAIAAWCAGALLLALGTG